MNKHLLSVAAVLAVAALAPAQQPATSQPATDAARAYQVSRDDALRTGQRDPETATMWAKAPVFVREPDGTCKATGLHSFEGVEEPIVRFDAASNAVVPDDFVNITDAGGGAVRMTLRYTVASWDGDQATRRRDRQRAEIKGLGPHQKDGETFEYGTTFRTDPNLKGTGRFCHIFQLKATDGDKGAPLVVVSIMNGADNAALRYVSGNGGFRVARAFKWRPGEWQTVRVRVKTTTANDGELLASVNGDEFQGVRNVPMFRPGSTDYRPKWGLYRGTSEGMTDNWIEHKDATAKKL